MTDNVLMSDARKARFPLMAALEDIDGHVYSAWINSLVYASQNPDRTVEYKEDAIYAIIEHALRMREQRA